MAKNHLAIDINTAAVRFVKLSGDFVVKEFSFFFMEKQDYRYKSQLEEFWNKTEWKEHDFDEISLSWSEKKSTLIPVNVFNESTKESIFSLSFGAHPSSDVIDYNRLPLQGVVNVFSMPLWLKSFFVVRFPRIVMQHEGTHLIRGMFNESTWKLKGKLVVHQDHFLLAIVQEGKLIFYSAFDFSSYEDVVYYFSFSLQQLAIQSPVIDLELISGAGNQIDLESIKSTLESLHKDKVNIQTGVHTLEKYQQLCV